MKTQRREHKSFLIDPPFQWAMIKRGLLIAGLNFMIFWGTVQYAFWAFEKKAHELNVDVSNPYFQILESQKYTLNILLTFAGVFNVLLIVGLGLMFSHRIAGPLYRLKTYFDNLNRGGEFRPLGFRKNDFFLDLATSANEYIEKAETDKPLKKSA